MPPKSRLEQVDGVECRLNLGTRMVVVGSGLVCNEELEDHGAPCRHTIFAAARSTHRTTAPHRAALLLRPLTAAATDTAARVSGLTLKCVLKHLS